MKKIFYVLALVATATLASCNQDLLDTTPTDEMSAETLLTDADGAQTAINGVYRMMKELGWSNGWEAENPGILTRILVSDLMGEDHYMAAQGQGWFFYDYMYNVDGDFDSTAGRQHAQWNLYYTLISQVNYIIAKEELLLAEGAKGADVVAQAYAVRAFCYMSLAEGFCQGNVPVNKDTCPGVPIYTSPTSMDTEGQPRGTLADTYAQINADYKAAYDNFKSAQANGAVQTHVSHLDLYATCVLWAYTALAEGEWQRAYDLATEALTKPGLARVSTISELGGFNSINVPSIMWGFEVLADQTGPYGPYHTHMDIIGGYGSKAPQCWSPDLVASIPETDERNAWFKISGDHAIQNKILIREATTSVADHVLIRAEEAILIAAEAACRLNDWTNARTLLAELGAKRDSKYADRLAARQDSNVFNEDTTEALLPRTLMEEVLWQRRVELWSEGFGRLYDLKRLNLGFTRFDGKITKEPGDYTFTYLLPQKEFETNQAISSSDQNPR